MSVYKPNRKMTLVFEYTKEESCWVPEQGRERVYLGDIVRAFGRLLQGEELVAVSDEVLNVLPQKVFSCVGEFHQGHAVPYTLEIEPLIGDKKGDI